MKRSIYILSLLIHFPLYGVFSEFVNITPSSPEKHQEHMVEVSSIFRSGEKYNFKIPYKEETKVYWLIICSEAKPVKERKFRDTVVWRNTLPEDIEAVVRIHPAYSRDLEEPKFISLTLSEEVTERAYVYKDFPFAVDDGGYYYCYDLMSFLEEYRRQKETEITEEQKAQILEGIPAKEVLTDEQRAAILRDVKSTPGSMGPREPRNVFLMPDLNARLQPR